MITASGKTVKPKKFFDFSNKTAYGRCYIGVRGAPPSFENGTQEVHPMKKIITVIVIAMLAAALAIGLAACNTGGGSGGSYNPGGGYGPDSGYDPGTGDGGTDSGGTLPGGDGGTDGGGTLPGGDSGAESAAEAFGFSAASAGMLISAMADGAAVTAADTVQDGVTAELDNYMALVESILSDGGFNAVAEESDRAEYAVKTVISYRGMDGSTLSYVMYYNETLRPDYDDDRDDRDENEQDFSIEGVMVIDGTDYAIRGVRSTESEPGETEDETEFVVTLSATSRMVVEYGTETEGSESEREYNYSVYENNRLVERSTFEYESERGETEIEMTYRKDGVTTVFFFDKELVRGEEVIRIRVGSAQSSDAYYVHIVTDADGGTHYEYEKINRV